MNRLIRELPVFAFALRAGGLLLPLGVLLIIWSTALGELMPADLLAFVSDRAGSRDIFLLDVGRRHALNLTHHPADEASFSWSPDGQRIVFAADRDGQSRLHITSLNGRHVVTLRDTPPAFDPVWSPAGDAIVFRSNRPDGRDTLYTIQPDGSGLRQLTQSDGWDSFASWSPDGAQLVFESNRNGDYDIYVVNHRSGAVRQITDAPGDDRLPSWSPDGERIAFVSDRYGVSYVFIMNADGSFQRRELTDYAHAIWWPAWSPDGSRVIFSSDQLQLKQMDARTGHITDIDAGAAFDPDVAPDGQHIAFTAATGAQPVRDLDIYLLGDGVLVNLTQHSAADEKPAWQPR